VIYSPSDLRLLQGILDDVLCDLVSEHPLVASDYVALKIKLATALFAASADGERDYLRLRQHALTAASALEMLGI